MLCERDVFDKCKDCGRKWLVTVDTPDDDTLFFCFETEAGARTARNLMENHTMYEGYAILPHTCIMFKPKGV